MLEGTVEGKCAGEDILRQRARVAKEVAGGLNGFGALLVMRKLMALLGRLMIGVWLWLRLKVATQRRKCKCNSSSEIVPKDRILKLFCCTSFSD